MTTRQDIKIMTPNTMVLAVIMLAGLVAALYRLAGGLGAATNLSDSFPWGLWIGVDVLGGVAVAAGGFLIAGAVHVLNMKKYKPIVRPAILTAFFGYLLAIIALFLDIGMPHRLWHPSVMWQIHSVMWVVAIHVMLYTTTLATESSPMFFERFNMPGAVKFVNRIIVPVVIFGVLLSVLHQSSLGALYLIVPAKLSPLWYSASFPSLPFLFLASAVMIGLSMVSFEYVISGRVFKHDVDMGIVSGLAKGSFIAIGVYLVLKLIGLVTGPGLGAAFDGSLEANMYLVEMVVGVLLPLILLRSSRTRAVLKTVFAANIMVIAGIVLNRFNVAVTGMYRNASATGADYFPSAPEFIVTLALISLAIFGFKLAAKYLDLFPGAEAGR